MATGQDIFGGRRVSVAEILAAFFDLARRRWAYWGGVWLAAMVSFDVLDLTLSSRSASPGGIAIFVAMYYFIERLLIVEKLASPAIEKSRRIGSYFGVGIASGLGVALGTLLLVVPGFWLMSRWSLVYMFVIGRGQTAGEAMKSSAAATAQNRWTIVGAYLLVYASAAIVLAGSGYLLWSILTAVPMLSGRADVTDQLVGNFVTGAVQPLGDLLSVAIFSLLVGHGSHYEEVFG